MNADVMMFDDIGASTAATVNDDESQSTPPPLHQHGGGDEQRRNWKLLIDPQLKKGLAKLYRFDGHCPPSHGVSAFYNYK